ncbi:hypothetical protein ACWD7Y_24890 [Streptomyces drozdowiczii]
MSDAHAPRARLRLNVAHSSWELIWSHVHRVLVVNLGVAAANLPLLAALQAWHEPWRYPLLFGPLLLLLPGPSLAAAFAYFDAAGPDGTAPVRLYARAYRRLFRRAVRVSAPLLLVATAAVAEVAVLGSTPAGAVLVPTAAVVGAVAALAWVVALAAEARERTTGWLIHLLAPYLVVRHAPMSLFHLVLLGGGLLLVNQAPLAGLAVVPGCVLFVVWHHCRSHPLPGGTTPWHSPRNATN